MYKFALVADAALDAIHTFLPAGQVTLILMRRAFEEDHDGQKSPGNTGIFKLIGFRTTAMAHPAGS